MFFLKIENKKNSKIKKIASVSLSLFIWEFQPERSQTSNIPNQRLDDVSQHCWGHFLNKNKNAKIDISPCKRQMQRRSFYVQFICDGGTRSTLIMT